VAKYYKKYGREMIELICDNCNKKFYRDQGKRNEHCFCCLECNLDYRHKLFYEKRNCPICNTEFETTQKRNKIYCSLECQIQWQRENPRIGKNHPSYKHEINHTINCDWCKRDFETGAYQAENGRRFCSNECRQSWYAQIWSQSKEWSEISKIRAVKILEDGLISQSLTNIQKEINEILNKLNLNYKSEKGFKYYCVDNYLIDFNLIIENMGMYWHCDHRKYPVILYDDHVNRIKKDKAKHSYLKNYYNIEILYLWESEIMSNNFLCELLIKKYIENNGILENYHSFNYHIENNKLEINKIIQEPYMNWNIVDLNKVVDIKVKEKMSRKQQDKWTIFQCEMCENEKEQLTSHYIKAKNHFCSQECFLNFKRYNNQLKKSATSVD
jgi:hypothetical protein